MKNLSHFNEPRLKKIYNDFRSNISNIGADTFSKIERESPIT